MICNLDLQIYDTIYRYASEQGRDNWGLTCHLFQKLHCENKRYLFLEKLISKNYAIHTNIGNFPLWQQLKKTLVILLGENHLLDTHRKHNSMVVRTLFLTGLYDLLVEGRKKEFGTNQVKYLPEEIVQSHETWDHERVYDQARQAIESRQYSQLHFISHFLTARDEKNASKTVVLCEQLIKDLLKLVVMDDNEIKDLATSLRGMKKYVQGDTSKQFWYYQLDRANALFLIGILVQSLIGIYGEEIKKIYQQSSELRNSHMFLVTERKIQSGRKAAIIAGADHVDKGAKKPIELFEEKKIFYVALLPLDYGTSTEQVNSMIHSIKETLGGDIREKLKSFNEWKPSATDDADEQLVKSWWVCSYDVLFDELKLCLEERGNAVLEIFKATKI